MNIRETLAKKIWVTRYALTTGIDIYENVTICEDDKGNQWLWDDVHYFNIPRADWHTSEESARKRVAEMVNKNLASLERRKAKLNWILECNNKTGEGK